MNPIDIIKAVVAKAEDILEGEPARAIGYGGAAIVYLVAKASGRIPDVTPEEALAQVGAALVVVASFVETVRKFVYSPATVDTLLHAETDVPTSGNM